MNFDPLLRALAAPTRPCLTPRLAQAKLAVGERAQMLRQRQPQVPGIFCATGLTVHSGQRPVSLGTNCACSLRLPARARPRFPQRRAQDWLASAWDRPYARPGVSVKKMLSLITDASFAADAPAAMLERSLPGKFRANRREACAASAPNEFASGKAASE